MDWLKIFKVSWPFSISIHRRTLVLFKKLDVYELEVCNPKIVRRERSFFRTDRLDKYHLLQDGSFTHEPLP